MNRNKSIFLNNLKGALAVCFAIVLCSADMNGQRTIYRSNGKNTSDNDIRMGLLNAFAEGEGTLGRGLTCQQFFKDTAGKDHVHFKKVTMTTFEAPDSSIVAHKRYLGKNIWFFNKHGFETANLSYDSVGQCADSILISYDKNDKVITRYTYQRPDSDKALKKVYAEIITRTGKGQMLKDSTWRKGNDYLKNGTMLFSVEVEKYDDKGNNISSLNLNSKDTESFYTYTYNDKNMMISEENKLGGMRTYMKYDDSLNMTENIHYSSYDTTREEHTYDKQNRELTEMNYSGNRLTSKTTYTYNPDGSYTEEEVDYTAPEGIETCDKEETTVTQFDRYKNKVSVVTTTTQGDESSTETVIDEYTYTPGGKVISDTERTTDASQWHITKTLNVQNNKYDAHENLVEQVSRGGQGNGNHKITCTYNDKDKALHIDFYNDCDGAPFGTEVCTYYPDGTTLQEQKIKMGTLAYSDLMCGKDSRLLNFTIVYVSSSMQGTIEYEE